MPQRNFQSIRFFCRVIDGEIAMPKKKTAVRPSSAKRRPAGVPVPVRAIDFVMFNSRDILKTRRFYQKLFGLKKGKEWNAHWSEFDTEPVSFCLNGATAEEPWMGNAVVAFAVDDIHDAAAACRKKGATIVREPFETRVCWMAIIADPDGNQICLHQRKNGTAG